MKVNDVNVVAAYVRLHAVLSPLAYLLKAPLVASGAPVVNALFKQRANIDNLLRAALALPPNNNLGLEHKVIKNLQEGTVFFIKYRVLFLNWLEFFLNIKRIKCSPITI